MSPIVLLALAGAALAAGTSSEPAPSIPPPPQPRPMPCIEPPCARDTTTTTTGDVPTGTKLEPKPKTWDDEGPVGFIHDVSTRLDCPSAAQVFFLVDTKCNVVTVGEAQHVEEILSLVLPNAVPGEAAINVKLVLEVRPLEGQGPCATWLADVTLPEGSSNDFQTLVVQVAAGASPGCIGAVVTPWRPEWQPSVQVIRQGSHVRAVVQTFMGRDRMAFRVEGLWFLSAEWW